MRRPWVALALVAAVLASGAGSCDPPPGIDGHLFDGWAPLNAATVPLPEVATCYTTTATYGWVLDRYVASPTASCADSHSLETYHVGQLSETTAPPTPNGPEAQKAYATCAREATTFLGDDWRSGRLEIMLWLPTAKQWAGKARFFRCDAMETASPAGLIRPRTGTLRNALTDARPYGLSCAKIVRQGTGISDLTPAACTAPHDAEYAGFVVAPDGPFPTAEAVQQQLGRLCEPVVLRFVGLTADQWITRRRDLSLLFWIAAGESGWQQGNRGIRCYVNTASGVTVRGSLKSIGTRALPR